MKYIFTALLLLFYLYVNAQVVHKSIEAKRIDDKLIIDGDLSEEYWKNAKIASDFITYSPSNGKSPYQKTKVKILYSDKAIYFGVSLYDSSPDSILLELSTRDQENTNTDNFEIEINPYNDGQNIFVFKVTAKNVQIDKKISSTNVDRSWNAVWESSTKITDMGWVAEIKIPYSAIRFPNKSTQLWAVNFWRTIRRVRETSTWNYVSSTISEKGSQAGVITGISDIKSPLRLSFYPYLSGYVQHNTLDNSTSYSTNGGMDLKLGLNESFTLDMTLIPDFGQVKSDNKVLNLSAYETKYSENRQFFTEGTELFSKANLFYSRRIGGQPSDYNNINLNSGEEIIDNPNETRLLNATKISGRNNNNLGIGFLNAVTGNTYATIKDSLGNTREILTENLINYNILSFDKVFHKNSFVNFVNTNVYKPKSKYTANVSALAFKFTDKHNKYRFMGNTSLSLKYDTASKVVNYGELYDLNLGKHNGNLYYNYQLKIVTDTYDPNDLGYLSRNNELANNVLIRYGIYEPFWRMLELSCSLSAEYQYLYRTMDFAKLRFSINTEGTFKNRLSASVNYSFSPTNSYDYFEPRLSGYFYTVQKNNLINIWLSSDYRKRIAIDVNTSVTNRADNNYSYNLFLSPRFRFNDHLLLIYSGKIFNNINNYGFVENNGLDQVVFGKRNIQNVINTISVAYVFNNKSSVKLNFRHYWISGDYSDFYYLTKSGILEENISYTENNDFNYNTLNLDLVYSLNFAPGSYLNIVWKNIIDNNSLIENNEFYRFNDNFEQTISSPQINSLSIKLIYYIDYLSLQK